MKKNYLLMSLLTSLFCFGCKSVPQDEWVQEKFPPVDFETDDKLLKIYFPTFCDDEGKVIGGDGIVVIFPDNTCMVIDGFYADATNQFIPYLKSLGITKIDSIVLTHYHGDHIGSLRWLMEAFPVGKVYTNGGHTSEQYCTNFLTKLKEKNLEENIWKEGDEITFGPADAECKIKVFSPNLTEEDKYNLMYNPGRTAKLVNDSSLVFKLTYGSFTALFTGDVYKKHDRELSSKYGDELHSLLMKLPHHGEFYTANSPKFVKTVHPEVGIICDNRYVGCIINNRYHLKNVPLLWNDCEGVISVVTDGTKVRFNHETGSSNFK